VLLWISIVFGGLSAVSWFASAVVTPDLSDSYFGGAPSWIKKRARIGSILNGTGALLASFAMTFQAVATYYAAT